MTLFRRTARTAVLGLVAGALAVTAQPAQAASITEGFDDITTLAGWQQVNPSATEESTTWRQGDPTSYFPAHSGAPSSYIAIDYRSGGDDVSSWLIAPQQASLSSTDVLSFWTRSGNPVDGPYPDRLEVRMSTNGSCNPGTTTEGVGDFTTLLGTINPDLADNGYPTEWTQYSLPLTGLGTTNVSGCLAFRYSITNTGTNGEYIGIDSVAFTDNASVACTTATATAGSAQAAVATASATLTSTTKALATAKKVLKKAKKKLKKAVKKAKRSGDDAAVAKAKKKGKKKVKKAKKATKKATASVSSSQAALATAQAALSAAQTSATTSCP
jgi:hypothetical protein